MKEAFLEAKIAAKTSEEKKEMMGRVFNQNLIDFLAKAYKMPSEIRAILIEKFDDLTERNMMMFAVMFALYLSVELDKDVEPSLDILVDYAEYTDKFFATAVKKLYAPTIEDALR